jgi:hypothetical protein
MEQKLVLGNKILDTLEQKITNSRTDYDYRWNKSLPPKNHGTKFCSRGTKICVLWNKILLIAKQIMIIGGTLVYLPKIIEQKLVPGEQKFGYFGTKDY